MNIQHLRYFAVIAKCENISKASQQLLVSQPALSNVLQQLEDELQVRLFERQGKRIILNQSGRMFLQTTENVLRMLDGSVRHLKESVSCMGQLQIGLHAICPELYEVIAAFCKEYPDVQIKLSKAEPNVDTPALSPCDLALLTEHECGVYPNVCISERTTMYAIFSKDHPLACRKTLKLRDLADEYFCFVSPHGTALEHAFHRCLESGFTPKVRYIADSAISALNLYLTESCIGLTYNTKLVQYQRDDLVLVQLEDQPVGRTKIHLCLLQEEPSPVSKMFFQFVQARYPES